MFDVGGEDEPAAAAPGLAGVDPVKDVVLTLALSSFIYALLLLQVVAAARNGGWWRFVLVILYLLGHMGLSTLVLARRLKDPFASQARTQRVSSA